MRTLVVVGGVGFKKWENMCRLNCVGVEKSEYINVGFKKWLKKTAFRCKKVKAKKAYHDLDETDCLNVVTHVGVGDTTTSRSWDIHVSIEVFVSF